MRDMLNAADLRRWAMQCSAQATDALCSAADSERLMKMRESLLALADNVDWLAGKASIKPTATPRKDGPQARAG